MSEKEAPPAQEVVATTPEEVADEPAAAVAGEVEAKPEDAAPTGPAVRIKRPVRPDSDEVKAKIEVHNDEIKKSKELQETVNKKMAAIREAQSQGSPELAAIKTELAQLKTEFASLIAQKQAAREQLEAANKARDAARANVKELKSGLKFTTVEAIDEQISKLEARQAHESLSLADEKAVLEDIRSLKRSRGAVATLAGKMTALESDDSARSELQAKLKELDAKIDATKAKQAEQREAFNAAKAKEDAKGTDYPSLREEMAKLRTASRAAYAKIKELRSDLDARWATYKADLDTWHVQSRADKAKRDEEWAKVRAEREAARLARIAENSPEPFHREVTFAEQLKAYLRRTVESVEGVGAAVGGAVSSRLPAGLRRSPAPAPAAADAASAPPSGLKAFKRVGKDEGAIQIGAPVKGRRGKGRREDRAPAPAPATAPVPAPVEEGPATPAGTPAGSAARLTHSLDILEAFSELGVSVPLTAADAAEARAAVEAKHAEYLALRQQAKDNPDDAELQARARASAAKVQAALGNDTDAAERPDRRDRDAKHGGDAPDAAGAPAASADAAKPAPAPRAARASKGSAKRPSAPPPELDDAESWPSMGGLAVPPPPAAVPAGGRTLAAAAAAAASRPAGKAPAFVRVRLTTNDADDTVAVAISPA